MKFYGIDSVGNIKVQRLTTGERTSTTADSGRVVYDTTLSKMYYGDGSNWQEFGTGGGGGTDFWNNANTGTTGGSGVVIFKIANANYSGTVTGSPIVDTSSVT